MTGPIEINAIMEAVKPAIDILLNATIKPKITKFFSKVETKYKEYMIPIGEHFEEYLYRSYKKYSIINTLVFKNEQRSLKELYLPLTISKTDEFTGKKEEIKIDSFPKELLSKYSRVLIKDTAGMGKSTLTKRMFLDVIDRGYGIPIYIELRRLSNEKKLLSEIQEQLNAIDKDFDSNLLLEFIKTGSFIFFLDGFDEISQKDRIEVTEDIQDFVSKANQNTFILTSRPEQALSSFGDFQCFKINSLSKKGAFELLRKYDNQGTTSNHLIEELKTNNYEAIDEFLKNPLLVSLLFAAFDYKRIIPIKKSIFYRQVYDAYFDSHDLSKGGSYIHDKHSKLDIDDFERVLRRIGYECLPIQKIEFEKDVLLNLISKAKSYCSDLQFTSSDFFQDILTAVPFFCNDGNYYKWVHKSMQEYFAAQFIFKDAKIKQDAILTKIYQSERIEKYINLLDIYYDIDSYSFNKNILLPLLKEYREHYNKLVFSSSIISETNIKERIENLFLREVYIFQIESNNNDIDENPFPNARKILKDKYFESLTRHIPTGICAANSESPKIKLLNLLHKRIPNLIQERNTKRYNYDSINLSHNDSIEITMNLGLENQCLYESYNQLSVLPYDSVIFIDYHNCVDTIKKIEEDIKRKEDTNDIVIDL